jgi:hypothetical protein
MEDPYDEFHVAHPLYLKGVAQERKRIIEILHGQHDEKHRTSPSGVCRACRILEQIVPAE